MANLLEEEIKERLDTKRLDKKRPSVSECSISSGSCYTIDNDQLIFVKTNASKYGRDMFEGEQESLKQIQATQTIRVPKPMTVIHNYNQSGASAIVMEFLNIQQLRDESARDLGQSLANLHDYNNKLSRFNARASRWIGKATPSAKAILKTTEETDENDEKEEEEEITFGKHGLVGKSNVSSSVPKSPNTEFADKFLPKPGTEEVTEFGFSIPTSCGAIPQVNEWIEEWIPFYARHRLDKPIRSLLSDHGDRELSEQWSQLQLKVDKFFTDYERDEKIVPALLHGDLWSGNMAQLREDNSRAVIYDPSSFYGHSEYDFGIARMFGAVPKAVEETYFQLMPKKKLFEKRNKLYQLFHHLNHWDHFGSGYRASTLRLIKELNTIV